MPEKREAVEERGGQVASRELAELLECAFAVLNAPGASEPLLALRTTADRIASPSPVETLRPWNIDQTMSRLRAGKDVPHDELKALCVLQDDLIHGLRRELPSPAEHPERTEDTP